MGIRRLWVGYSMSMLLRGTVIPAALLALSATALAQNTTGGAPPRDPLLDGAPPKDGGIVGGPPKDQPGTVPGGVAVEFAAPTAEDWARPCLLTFQRTWEDAVAVARETNRPILICVNMDGEPASENYAGVRYRRPEIAALYEPYVCVIASVYRHTPKDHDDEGRRILCPRFGSVTCGEHISIEPFLYEKYFDGKRISPRHLMIELDGKETYDVFFANDVDSVLRLVRKGITERKKDTRVVVRGDRPIVERVASRDVTDRAAVEAAYRDGDAALRRRLLEAAAKNPDAAPLELQRLALFGLDAELAALARTSLAGARAPEAVGLIAEALKAPLDAKERDALIAALTRLGERNPRARWVSAVHRGLSGKSEVLDAGGWIRGAEYPANGAAKTPDATAEAPAPTDEASAALVEAENSLVRGLTDRTEDGGNRRIAAASAGLHFEDARRAARRALELGGGGWRAEAVLAIADWYDGRAEESYVHAEAAAKGIPPGDSSWNSWQALTIFAEGRWKAIKREVTAKRDWPPSWLTDLHAAFSILGSHPRGTDAQAAWHHELLEWLGSKDQAARALAKGLERFPLSEPLHARLRGVVLAERGADGLEAEYAARLAAPGRPKGLEWFAGLASAAAAKGHLDLRRGQQAADAFQRAEAFFDAAAKEDPDAKEKCDRAAALAIAGRARIASARGQHQDAVDAILAACRRGADAVNTKGPDAVSPADIARDVVVRLRRDGKEYLATKVEKALAALPANPAPGGAPAGE